MSGSLLLLKTSDSSETSCISVSLVFSAFISLPTFVVSCVFVFDSIGSTGFSCSLAKLISSETIVDMLSLSKLISLSVLL